jgi:hypothetical protein
MSSQTTRAVATGALLILATGCRDDSTQPSASTQALLADAFVMTAPGFDSLSTSFPGAGFTGTFAPRMRGDGRGGPMSGGPGMRAFMGGGIGDAFIGGIAAGPQRGRGGPFGGEGPLDGCTFDAASGDVTCTPITRDSLVITRRFRFTTAAGTAQARRDSTTDRVATTRTVTGSTTFAPGLRRGFGPGFGPGGEGGPNGAGLGVTTARTTVNSSSSQVVTGLAAASASRTVNGASAGTESTTGTRNATTFTSQRVMGDTTTNLVIPNATTGFPYPTAGTVVRSMRVTVTSGTEAPVTSTRREVVTYDGSATARVVITQDGETRTCTMPLPRGRLTCQ